MTTGPMPLIANSTLARAAKRAPAKTLSICLINPRFEPSYWGFEFALPLYPGDKRSTMVPGSLAAVAGLCGDREVYLLDENVEDIDWEFVQSFDLVGVTGMNVQKLRMRQILIELRERKEFTVVGQQAARAGMRPLSRVRRPPLPGKRRAHSDCRRERTSKPLCTLRYQ